MTLIATTSSSLTDSLLTTVNGNLGTAASASTATPASLAGTAVATGLGPATVVDLSDAAKAAVTRANSNQAAADRLQAYVEAHSVSNRSSTGSTANNSTQSDPFQKMLDASAPSPEAQSTSEPSKSETIIANIQAVAAAGTPQPPQPFVPTKAVSGSLSFAGYTIDVSSDPSRLYSGLNVTGNGVSAYSRHFWPSDGGGGVDAAPPGVSISGSYDPNTPGVETVTISQNTTAATSASVASSSGTAAATGAVAAQASTITFTVNYATGDISVQQSIASLSAKASIARPGSLLSSLA